VGRGSTDKRTILIVDDEDSIRLICRINFASSGWRCVEAANGNEALETVRRERPDIVLLDVMMPELDGWAVAQQLAEDPATSGVPIVFLTARADMRDRAQAHAAGAVAFVTKPMNPVTLPAAMEELIARLDRGEREQLRTELLESDI
jgi:CheY-like chemotaxis protein